MKNLIIRPIKFILCIYLIILFEGLCFRFVESYADFRLRMAWGEVSEKKIIPTLLLFDHFKETPKGVVTLQNTNSRASEENEYTKSILSFGRPLKDRYEQFRLQVKNPLQDYVIRNLENESCRLDGVIFPKLKRSSTLEDVNNRVARREGDILEFARAMLIFAYRTEDVQQKDLFDLKYLFSFLLERGIACVSVPYSSSENLIAQIDLLKNEYALISNNLILWGLKNVTMDIVNAVNVPNDLFSMIILQYPEEISFRNLSSINSAWLTCVFSKNSMQNFSADSFISLFEMINSARNSEYTYQRKMGGVLQIHDDGETMVPIDLLTLILKCVEFNEAINFKKKSKSNFADLFNSTKSEKSEDKALVKKSVVSFENSFSPKKLSAEEQEYDCETVRTYRSIHKDDQLLRDLTNAQIILELGKAFEQRGQESMSQITQQDPQFTEFYRLLKDQNQSIIKLP